MLFKDTLHRHAALVDKMATARGVDLEEAALRGDVSIPEIDDAVLACTGCSNPGACEGWLARQTERASRTPDYCRNSDLFRRLAPGA